VVKIIQILKLLKLFEFTFALYKREPHLFLNFLMPTGYLTDSS